jgi:hypothetical protein
MKEVKRRRAAAGGSPTKAKSRLPSPTNVLSAVERTLESFVEAIAAASARCPDLTAQIGKSERKRMAQRLEEAIPKQRALAKALVAERGR